MYIVITWDHQQLQLICRRGIMYGTKDLNNRASHSICKTNTCTRSNLCSASGFMSSTNDSSAHKTWYGKGKVLHITSHEGPEGGEEV